MHLVEYELHRFLEGKAPLTHPLIRPSESTKVLRLSIPVNYNQMGASCTHIGDHGDLC